MSNLEKFGDPKELNVVFAEDCCPVCNAVLLKTAEGGVCLACNRDAITSGQGEEAWEAFKADRGVSSAEKGISPQVTETGEREICAPTEPEVANVVPSQPQAPRVPTRELLKEMQERLPEVRELILQTYQKLARVGVIADELESREGKP